MLYSHLIRVLIQKHQDYLSSQGGDPYRLLKQESYQNH